MTLNKLLIATAFSTLPCFIAQAQPTPSQPNPVPGSYQALYSSLQADMSTFTQSIPVSYSSSTFYASQLLSASSDNGMNLLAANAEIGVQMELNQLHALGVSAVTVHIDFPYLYAPFYSPQTTGQASYQEMLAFYTNLTSTVHGMGMKLIVETQVAKPDLAGNVSPAAAYAKQLPWASYMAGRAQNAANVAELVRPDYLTVISEPDTEAQMSGQTQAGTVTGSVQMLQAIITAVDAAGAGSTKLGAGVGSWMPNISAFMTMYAKQPINYLDLHVYTVNKNFLQNTLVAAAIAHQAGKQIAMTEAWLQKVSDAQLGQSSSNVGVELNNYSFFEPLDAQFLQAMVKLANFESFTFISPFWSNYFFAYLPYAAANSSSIPAAFQAASAAMQQGQYSAVAPVYEKAILISPDHMAPQVMSAPATVASKNAVGLTWQPGSDNVGVAGYQVFKNGTLIGATSFTNFLDSAGSKGSGATYTLTAFDASGNVSPHSASSVVH